MSVVLIYDNFSWILQTELKLSLLDVGVITPQFKWNVFHGNGVRLQNIQRIIQSIKPSIDNFWSFMLIVYKPLMSSPASATVWEQNYWKCTACVNFKQLVCNGKQALLWIFSMRTTKQADQPVQQKHADAFYGFYPNLGPWCKKSDMHFTKYGHCAKGVVTSCLC